jgi:ribosomal-protein-alanine N-acetyltransferase
LTEAVKAVIRYGIHDLSLNRIEAKAMIQNIGSWRVMEKVGMHFEGTLKEFLYMKGAYHDLKLYALLREEYFKNTGGLS